VDHKLDANELDTLDIEGVGEIHPDMELEHPIFGIGKVEAIYQFIKSGDITIRIDFEEHGSKALVPEFAKLSLPKTNSSTKNSILKILFGGWK